MSGRPPGITDEQWLEMARALHAQDKEKTPESGVNGHDPEPDVSTEVLRQLRVDIGLLNEESPPDRINEIIDRIATDISDEILHDNLLRTLKAQTKTSLGPMRKRLGETIGA